MTKDNGTHRLDKYLRENETTTDLKAVNGFDISYLMYPITDGEGREGDSVLLEMENHGKAVEAVELVGDVTLTVRAVAGTGVIIKRDGESGDISAFVLDADKDIDDTEPVLLHKGDSYAYLNVGKTPFIVRDDCEPSFHPEYEVPATDPDLLQTLGQLGIFEYSQ